MPASPPAPSPPSPPAPGSPRLRRLLTAGVAVYLLALLGVTVLLLVLAGRWWVATVVLFGPRWLWALPLLLLVPLAWLRHRRLLVPLALASLLLLFPVGGFELPSPGVLLRGSDLPDLRVMTYNLGGGHADPKAIPPPPRRDRARHRCLSGVPVADRRGAPRPGSEGLARQ